MSDAATSADPAEKLLKELEEMERTHREWMVAADRDHRQRMAEIEERARLDCLRRQRAFVAFQLFMLVAMFLMLLFFGRA